MKAIIAFAILAVACFAQTAKVIELPADEAAHVKALWDAKQAADKAWEDEGKAMKRKFLATVITCHECSDNVDGYEFSEKDFRFIVPKQYPWNATSTTISSGTINPCWIAPTGTTNPADLAVHPLGSADWLRDCLNCSPGYLSLELKGLTK